MTRIISPQSRPPAPDIESLVFQRAGQVTMQVRQPDSPWSLGLGIAVAVILGVIVFVTLSEGRQARADALAQKPQAKPPAAAPIVLAQAAPAPLAPAVQTVPAPPPAPPVQNDDSTALHAPVMVVDQSTGQTTATATAAPSASGQARAAAGDTGGSAEERFAAQVESGGVETSHATRLTDLRHTVPQGTVIPAVLETAINSDLPGSVRAVVSRDVTGFDGAEVLIPRGSKLIGQYRSGMAYGQSRAFVIWSRILTPDGVSIDVGSPAVDTLGRGGLAGETDTHFFERFGSSILLSAVTAGLEVAAQSGSGTSVIIGSPLQASSLASMAPQQIPVTIKVMQGTPLQVFLVRDLDFSGVAR
ncbi:MAG TPA: TrbI/VirB10 family protein [Caulobacteraceae bacterium]|nr:TrbI/VirB10 family protein [Caulobacteraceae bacterium]